jgi:ABC transport permease subunit
LRANRAIRCPQRLERTPAINQPAPGARSRRSSIGSPTWATWYRLDHDDRRLCFGFRTVGWLFARLPRRETLLPSFSQIGVLSWPVVALTGVFIGMVLAVQGYSQFRVINLETRLGAVINMSLVRELGPVLAATMLAGRVGSAMAAELGTMRVTEQIDALSSMGANPVQYLVVPRFLVAWC